MLVHFHTQTHIIIPERTFFSFCNVSCTRQLLNIWQWPRPVSMIIAEHLKVIIKCAHIKAKEEIYKQTREKD